MSGKHGVGVHEHRLVALRKHLELPRGPASSAASAVVRAQHTHQERPPTSMLLDDAQMKEMDLSGTNTANSDMRDLKTVEKDIAEKLERKDRLSNEVSNIFI